MLSSTTALDIAFATLLKNSLSIVDEAVASFSTKNPGADCRIWLKIANRVGAEAFMDAVWQKQSEIGHDCTCLSRGISSKAHTISRACS